MISIIITSFKEPDTIGRAIQSFLDQNLQGYELIISAPDNETLAVARSYQRNNHNIILIRDPGRGKPTALNEVFRTARGSILILSDGDVFVGSNSVKKLIRHFENPQVGAVSGRVISTNPRKKMFGFWAYALTEINHLLRLREQQKGNLLCSGYLYAVRKELVSILPENILADDAFISLQVSAQRAQIMYESAARVYVKYPTNLPDWIRQKKRTAAKFYQLSSYFPLSKSAHLTDELLAGLQGLRIIRSLREVFWFIALAVMRIYIWARVVFDVRLWARSFERTWERVESTK